MKTYIKTTYRDIAIMLAKNLPLEGEDFGDKVNSYLEIIKSLPQEAKLALKSAYVFSAKVPREEREDLFQELTLAILKAKTKDEPFAYAIARCDWQNWWRKYKTREQFFGGYLSETVTNAENQATEIGELIVGEAEFERKMDGKLDAQRIWGKLPDMIKPIIQRRLLGYPLNANERQKLSRYVKAEGYKLLIA